MDINFKKDEILSYFSCQKTGNCCRADGIVYVDVSEIEKMATLLGLCVTEFMTRYVRRKNGWMVIADHQYRKNCFLDQNQHCKVYAARPKQCMTYPNWPEIWESKENLMKETLLCPALRKATKVVERQGLSCIRHLMLMWF